MISTVYKRMFSVLKKRFFSLLGVLLLAIILWFVSSIAVSFIPLAQLGAAAQSWARASRTSSTGVPLLMYLLMAVVYALWFCVLLLLSASMSKIYLGCCRTGLAPNVSDLFAMFRTGQFFRILGGMAWMCLWIFLWSLIPIAGIVFGTIRAYEYRFVPYILMTREDVRATDAVKLSKQETLGYKGEMYGADILLAAVYWVLTLALYLLTLIPHSNAWLSVLVVLLNLIMLLFRGVLQAAVYDEIQKRRTASAPQPSSPVPPTRPAQPEWPVPSEWPDAAPTQPIQYDVPAQSEQPAQPEWPDAPTQPIQYDVPAQPEPAEPVTQPAPQGKPVVFSLEPELPAQPQWTNRYCPHCGAPVKLSDAVFCTVCGKSLS